jgi:hypothetical protein
LQEAKDVGECTGPRLFSLAADAAVELDLRINDEPSGLGAVRHLGEQLGQSLENTTPDQPAPGLQVDTETAMDLAQAFTRAGMANPATILSELAARTQVIGERLGSADAQMDRGLLESCRAFCLALSQSAAAYRQSVVDTRPPHPYRR